MSSIPEYGLPVHRSGGPYQSAFGGEGGVWRDGKTLVMHKTARLPDYCIKCGMPANGTSLRKRLSWHHPALALLILAGVLIYVIVAVVLSKSATVDISLCEDHLQKHRTALVVSWGLLLAGVAFIGLAIALEKGGSALFGGLLIVSSIVSALTWTKVVNVKKIDEHYVWLRKIDESFLRLLPNISIPR